MRKIAIFLLLSITLLSIVTAQQIGDIKVETQKGGGATATFAIINNGETGGYNVYGTCNGNSIGNNQQGTINSGESKTISLNLPGEGCNQIITCTIFIESVGNNLQKSVTFVNDCSLCGTGFETCQSGAVFCSGDQVKQCDQYCRTSEVVETCQKGCFVNNGLASCQKQFEWAPILFYGGIIFVILLILLIIILKKRK